MGSNMVCCQKITKDDTIQKKGETVNYEKKNYIKLEEEEKVDSKTA